MFEIQILTEILLILIKNENFAYQDAIIQNIC